MLAKTKLANAFSVNLSAVDMRSGKIIPEKIVRNIIFSQTEKLSQFVIGYCYLNPCQSSFTGLFTGLPIEHYDSLKLQNDKMTSAVDPFLGNYLFKRVVVALTTEVE